MFVGRRVRRKEDLGLITGSSRYVDDIELAGKSYVAILRSPYAHAKIKAINSGQARGLPGVLDVITGAEVKKTCNPMPYLIKLPFMKTVECYPLAVGKVRFVGEPVAAVVAKSRYLAEDALEKIQVEYDKLPPLLDAETAMNNSVNLLYEEWGTNIRIQHTISGGDVEQALQGAALVFKDRIKVHRHTGCPIEPRTLAADYDKISGFLTLWASTQKPHILRSLLAEGLGHPEAKIRVVKPAVGGSFGLKNPLYPEDVLIPLLSMRLGGPVKWAETRRDNLTAANHAHEQVHYVEVGLNDRAEIVGLKDKIIGDLGVCYPNAQSHFVILTSLFLPGPYKIRNYRAEIYGVVTNKASCGAYRGFGKAMSNYVMERLMDKIARELEMDPLKLRERNLIREEDFPYTSVTGCVYDSGSYLKCIATLREKAAYSELRREQEKKRRNGENVGIGVSFMIEPSAAAAFDSLNSSYETATVRIDPSGKITVLTGIASQGQGHETTLAQIAADELSVDLEDVVVVEGDTLTCPYGLGAWASRSAPAGAPAVMLASRKLRLKIASIASHLLSISQEKLRFVNGDIQDESGRNRISLKEVARVAYAQPYRLPPGVEPGLEATHCFVIPNISYVPNAQGQVNLNATYSYGAFISLVEVDRDTGQVKVLKFMAVHDCGTIINPNIVEGLLYGGFAQGIGAALSEELLYDDAGQPVITTLMDYGMPTACDLPNFDVEHLTTPSPFIPGGFKGMAEGGNIGAFPSVVNAIEDALSSFGNPIDGTPLTPNRIWQMIHGSS